MFCLMPGIVKLALQRQTVASLFARVPRLSSSSLYNYVQRRNFHMEGDWHAQTFNTWFAPRPRPQPGSATVRLRRRCDQAVPFFYFHCLNAKATPALWTCYGTPNPVSETKLQMSKVFPSAPITKDFADMIFELFRFQGANPWEYLLNCVTDTFPYTSP